MAINRPLIITLVLILAVYCSPSDDATGGSGEVIEVHPGQSIQNALDLAKTGDTVLVHPGIYKPEKAGEAFIVFRQRHNGVMLKGAGTNPDMVIIDGDEKVIHVVFFDQGIDRATVMSGFTIRGGVAFPTKNLPKGYRNHLRPEINHNDDFYHDGAGVMIYNSSPIIKDNIITGNIAERCGGGISVFVAQYPLLSLNKWLNYFNRVQGPLIYNNIISHNNAAITGAGIDVYFGTKAYIVNNILMANRSHKTGGAISVLVNSSAEIRDNSIVGNEANKNGSGVHVSDKAKRVDINNTIFAYNQNSDVIASEGNNVTVADSCFYRNDGDYIPPLGNGNIIETPLKKEPQGKHYQNELNRLLSKKGSATEVLLGPCSDVGYKLQVSYFPDSSPIIVW